ncbi:MAG TPA: tetratricopeptide repeat protein [Acidobacteriota bacterium]|nr:tetratricopeptide repeat protein [Acidobacteriota bacterium]
MTEANGSKPLRKMPAPEFARRLREWTCAEDQRFAFLLGAGCSVSSGIPASAELVKKHWLPRLHKILAPGRENTEDWARDEFPGYEPQNAAAFYGPVMEKLFLNPENRQREIESLCDGKFPGFGYACLSRLMMLEGGCFNVALTTNFDDMIADALYLFTPGRPLVIHHESLASYIRPTRMRPLVVKMHGDHRLTPLNTEAETGTLKAGIEKQVRSLLYDRGLVFIGYGGNDNGIVQMLRTLPQEALPLGVFWVSGTEPQGVIRPWLEQRDSWWVESGDFDELMLLVRDAFDLPHPEEARFKQVFAGYFKKYETLSKKIAERPEGKPDTAALREAAQKTDETFPNWYALYLEAKRIEESDPDGADRIYREGLERFPSSPDLLGAYAIFLDDVRKDADRAEEYYQRAIEADPKRAENLSNYAVFLKNFRKDPDRAEEFYRRALAAGPDNPSILFSNYAVFLGSIRQDADQAEAFFRRAVKADPDNANILSNCAGFFLAQGRPADGLPALTAALEKVSPETKKGVLAECWFYAFAHRPEDQRAAALSELKKVLSGGARSLDWDFAPNIDRARQDGHPDIEWLEKLADVINEKADISVLDEWDKWKSA